jgi:hypothetical protein
MQQHHHITLADYDHAEAIDREAARILARLIDYIHVAAVTGTGAKVELDLPLSVFDRLALWGSRFENLEPEPDEDDGDLEDESAV